MGRFGLGVMTIGVRRSRGLVGRKLVGKIYVPGKAESKHEAASGEYLHKRILHVRFYFGSVCMADVRPNSSLCSFSGQMYLFTQMLMGRSALLWGRPSLQHEQTFL